jgi:hypothetical protein
MGPTEEDPGVAASGRAARFRRDLVPLYALAAVVLCAAGGWYLLEELAPLLRPLVLAVFLAYTILPVQQMIQGWAGYQDRILTLAQETGPPLVGKVTVDPAGNRFAFKPPGMPKAVVGLSFKKAAAATARRPEREASRYRVASLRGPEGNGEVSFTGRRIARAMPRRASHHETP